MNDTIGHDEQAVCIPGHRRAVLFQHAVLRAAAWPIETVQPFEAPELALSAAATLAAEQRVLATRDATTDALHAAVPAFPQKQTRAYLLAIRRQIFGDTLPLPEPAPAVAADLASDAELTRVIDEERARRRDLADQRAAFVRLHDELLEQQRQQLRVVAGADRFRKALIIANPLVASRWNPDADPGNQTAKVRRMEGTIFHYLMRAAGRWTPHGGWAGVAPVLPADPQRGDSDGLTVEPAPARYDVTVNLLPFTVMLGQMARQLRYRQGYPLRLNPTLHPLAEGWRYEREASGIAEWQTLEGHPLHRVILDYFADGEPRPAEPMLDALERQASSGNPRLRSALEQLISTLLDRDVLRSALELPSTASSIWEALDGAVAKLVEPDRARWAASVERLKALCGRLGVEWDALSVAEVDVLRREVEAEIQALWEAQGLPGTVQPPVLRLDMRLPLALRWGARLQATAERMATDLLAFKAADGGADLLRRISLQDVAKACGTGEPVALLTVLSDGRLGWSVRSVPQLDAEDADPTGAPDSREMILGSRLAAGPLADEARAHCERWERLLDPVAGQASFTLPPPNGQPTPFGPGGALLLRLAGPDDLWFGWGRPEPGMYTSRFVQVLRDDAGGEFPLFGELRAWAEQSAESGATPIELVGWAPLDPNVAVRGPSTPTILDPHGPSGLNLRDMQVVIDPTTLRPWLLGPQAPGLLAPMYQTAAAIGFHDRCQRLLLQLARGHGWEILGHGMPASRAERARWGHRPRLRLPTEQVASPERWTVLRETVAEIGELKGAERYLAWRRLVQSRKLPDLVHARGGPLDDELLVRTDSPLAVRCLFDGMAARAPWLELTELPGDPASWPITDATGQHYLGELAVVWHDDAYWSDILPTWPGEDNPAEDNRDGA